MIHVLGQGYESPFVGWGDVDFIPAYNPQDVIVFTGGADVSPYLYNQEREPFTQCNPQRDELESSVFNECVRQSIPMVGICRGSQFLNVMNGGSLIQHQREHAGHDHDMHTLHDRFYVTSTHHQMAIIPDHADLIGWAHERGDDPEPEVWWFEDTKSLCVQYHPEYMSTRSEGWQFFQMLLARYIF